MNNQTIETFTGIERSIVSITIGILLCCIGIQSIEKFSRSGSIINFCFLQYIKLIRLA